MYYISYDDDLICYTVKKGWLSVKKFSTYIAYHAVAGHFIISKLGKEWFYNTLACFYISLFN